LERYDPPSQANGTRIWSGCRISEALALTPRRIDLATSAIVFETLKKRRAGVYRTDPGRLGIMLNEFTKSSWDAGPFELTASTQ